MVAENPTIHQIHVDLEQGADQEQIDRDTRLQILGIVGSVALNAILIGAKYAEPITNYFNQLKEALLS